MATSPSTSLPPPDACRQVIKLAILSRAALLTLIVLCRALGSPYDTSALLNPPCLPTTDSIANHQHQSQLGYQDQDQHPLDRRTGRRCHLQQGLQDNCNSNAHDHHHHQQVAFNVVRQALERSVVWDAVYYIRIAECGYEYEQTFAFFPVLPFSIRFMANTVFFRLVPLVGYRATLALSGFILNNIAFVLAAVFFFKVSVAVLEDQKLAFQATALFCVNPASIFYASIYSESLFALFTFTGLWEFLSGSKWRAAFLFGISGGLRSNGILHGGFLLYRAIQDVYKAFCYRNFKTAVRIVGIVVLQTAVVFCPFMLFQSFGFLKLCYASVGGGIDNIRPWCNAKIPYLYGFVQSHYWNVGFMRYFQVKQLPNFLLASPILSLAICSIATYLKYKPTLLLSLGLHGASTHSHASSNEVTSRMQSDHVENQGAPFELIPKTSEGTMSLQQRKKHSELQYNDTRKLENTNSDLCVKIPNYRERFLSPAMVPFLLEMAFMSLVAIFIMHVQVATRFLSICPPVYWFSAYIIHSSSAGYKLGCLIWAIFLFYVSLGSLLFVNFYPFT